MITGPGRRLLDELRLSHGLDESLPWGGRSPRALTEAHQRFRLKPRGDDAHWFFHEEEQDEQYRRFLGVSVREGAETGA